VSIEAEYSAFESTLNSAIVSYRIAYNGHRFCLVTTGLGSDSERSCRHRVSTAVSVK